MKTIDHGRARRYLHAQLDGALEVEDSSRLSAHLQGCPACRRYAAEMTDLHARLRREARLQRRDIPLFQPLAEQIFTRLEKQRPKMKTDRLFTTGGLAFIVLLVLLAGGLSLLLDNTSIRGILFPLANPGAPAASPSPTGEPANTPQAPEFTPEAITDLAGISPYSQENPLTDLPQIIALLEKLGKKDLKRLRSTNWVHIVEANSSSYPFTPSTREKWIQPFPEDGPCPNRMTEVRAIEGNRELLQLLVSLSDGTYGELVELKAGKGEVYRTGPECKMSEGDTEAGLLALRILGKASLSNSDLLQEARAWYETRAGREYLLVYTRFEGSRDAEPIWEETFTFDTHTGLLVERLFQQSWKSGDEIYTEPENRQTFEYEYLETLDDDTAARFASAAAELQSYAIYSGTYSQEDPLTALPQIIALLEDLGDKNLEAFLGASWVHTTYKTEYSPTIPMSTPPLVGESWMQYSPEAGPCPRGLDESRQDMDTEISLACRIVYLADGTVANLQLQEDGTVNAGQRGDDCALTRDGTRAGILASVLRGERRVQGKMGNFTLSEARAWIENVDGLDVLVVFVHHEKTTPPPVLKETYTFDLESGLLLSLVQEEGWKDGRVIQQTWETLQYEFLEGLDPEALAKIEAAEAELRAYLEAHPE